MISEVPFTLDRWKNVRLQPEQEHEPPTPEYAERLVSEGVTWAYDDADGHTIAVGGLYPVGPGQAVAWTYLGCDSGPYILALVRAMKRAMDAHKNRWPVLRASVLKDFAAGQRLMALLGFVPLLGTEPIAFRARIYLVYQKVHYGGH